MLLMNTYAPQPAGRRRAREPRERLTGPEMRRYSRHLLLPGLGESGQLALVNARVAVVGAGGLGSPILQYLAAAGVGELTVIDPDLVDESNLQRQVIHSEDSVGTAKVRSAVRAVAALNSSVRVTAIDQALTPANALEVLSGHDVVLDGTDNFPTRYLVSDACEILNIPLVWGSILAFHGQVSVFWGNGGRGVTYRDLHPRPPRPGEVPSCADAGVLGMLVGVIGSTMAMEAVKILTGLGTPLLGRVQVYDALAGTWSSIEVERTPGRAPVTQIEDLVVTCGFPPLPGLASTARPTVTARSTPPVGPAATDHGALEEGSIFTPAEALDQAERGRLLIDLREDHEVAAGMLPGAIHIPFGALLALARGEAEAAGPLTSPEQISGAIVHCQGGGRSARAQSQLAELGIAVSDMAGGYRAATGTL